VDYVPEFTFCRRPQNQCRASSSHQQVFVPCCYASEYNMCNVSGVQVWMIRLTEITPCWDFEDLRGPRWPLGMTVDMSRLY
jgi:hypothetical protein